MNRLLMERDMIDKELDCSEHEPIEVVLIFDQEEMVPQTMQQQDARRKRQSNKTRHQRVVIDHSFRSSSRGGSRKRSRGKSGNGSGGNGDNKLRSGGRTPKLPKRINEQDVYYDPTKLQFVFSTPSPLTRKFIELRDRSATEATSGNETAESTTTTTAAGIVGKDIYDMSELASKEATPSENDVTSREASVQKPEASEQPKRDKK